MRNLPEGYLVLLTTNVYCRLSGLPQTNFLLECAIAARFSLTVAGATYAYSNSYFISLYLHTQLEIADRRGMLALNRN